MKAAKSLRLCVFVFHFLFSSELSSIALSQVEVAAEAAIVMNADTGAVLYEKNAHQICYPASLTKIATALYTLEESRANLENLAAANQSLIGFVTAGAKRRSHYTLPAYYLEFGATHMGIHPEEQLKLKDLLYGMMVSSANDAANVIAAHVSGSIPQFMKELNAYLHKLGLKSTYFMNPHGLHHPDHVTTAYELARLTSFALQSPIFCDIVQKTHYPRPKTNKESAGTLVQTNRLLRKGKYYYPKAIGVKTGFHSDAKNTLAAAARCQGRTLIVILLKEDAAGRMFQDAISLFEAAFAEPKLERTLLKTGLQPLYAPANGSSQVVQAALSCDVKIQFYPAEESQIIPSVQWKELHLPVKKGEEIGTLTLTTAEGQAVAAYPLFAAKQTTSSIFFQLTALHWAGLLFLLALAAVLLFLYPIDIQ